MAKLKKAFGKAEKFKEGKMMKRNWNRRTLESAFGAGFVAGMAAVHSQDLVDQERDYFKAWKRGDEHWCKKTLEKYQKMDLEEK